MTGINHGFDDVIDRYIEKRSTAASLEYIAFVLAETYLRIIEKRREQGNLYTGMSRKDYQKHKRADYPNYWIIAKKLGGWKKTGIMLPPINTLKLPRDRINSRVNVKDFSKELSRVARLHGIDPASVTVRQWRKYVQEHPEKGFPDHRGCTKAMGAESWEQAKKKALGRS